VGEVARTAQQPKVGVTARISSWLKSFSGIVSSLATIIAAVATLVAAHQTMRVQEQGRIIVHQQEQLQAARVSGGTTLPQEASLSALQPTIQNASLQDGPQIMSAKSYPKSVTFSCNGTFGQDGPDEAYDVAGHHLFTAVVGIPDNASNATDLAETVTFASENGTPLAKPVVVSLGSPATVEINISGVTQLQMTCTGQDENNQQLQENGNQLALGDAAIS
jgi:hypothetical protein